MTALRAATPHRYDYLHNYVNDLALGVDLDAVGKSGLKVGADPLGGAGVHYWGAIADHDRHGIVARSVGLMPPNHYLSVAIDCFAAAATSGKRW